MYGITKIYGATFWGHLTLAERGAAIRVEKDQDVYLERDLFLSNRGYYEGGSVFVNGTGIFNCSLCCFIRSSVSMVNDNFGGNAFCVYSHSTYFSDSLIFLSASDQTKPYGDSTFMSKSTKNPVHILRINYSNNVGRGGGMGGGELRTNDPKYSYCLIRHGKDYSMFELFEAAWTVDHSAFLDNIPDHKLWAVAKTATFESCSFFNLPKIVAQGASSIGHNCFGDSNWDPTIFEVTTIHSPPSYPASLIANNECKSLLQFTKIQKKSRKMKVCLAIVLSMIKTP